MATLSELRTRARERADMELASGQSDTTHFITNAELNRYINASIKELHDLIVQAPDSSYFLTSTTVTGLADTKEYALPATFYKLAGVDREDGTPVKKFNWEKRNKAGLRYRLRGGNLRFDEVPPVGEVFTVWYHSKPTDLSADGDTYDGVNGWDEYVVVDAAIKMKSKQEDDVSSLMAEKTSLLSRVQTMAQDRDVGEPEVMKDVKYDSPLDSRGWEMDD